MEFVKCHLCGSDDSMTHKSAVYHLNLVPPIEIKRCLRCGFIYMSPRPDALERDALFSEKVPDLFVPYTKHGANYGAVTEGRLPFFVKRVNKLVQMLGKPVSEVRLLDVGASSGFMVEAALRAGINAIGIEPGNTGIQSAKRRGILLVQGVAEKLPFEDNAFDIVHSHHVFEHVADPLRAAQEAFRVLKPHGIAIIEVPNQFDNIRFRRDELIGRVSQRERNIRSVHHLSFFSRRTLRALMEKCNFSQISITSEYSVIPRGIMAPLGYLSMSVGKFFLGGERVIAIASK